jgi:signal transduction histidine kinase
MSRAALLAPRGARSERMVRSLVAAEEKPEHSARLRTDESLEDERRRTIDELAKRSAIVEGDAAAVLGLARERAEQVLDQARAGADQKLAEADTAPEQLAVVAQERRHEDQARHNERIIADREIDAEREARTRALAALLALEREQTDQDLTEERHRADRAIRSRDEFLGMASHDIRNMLGGMAMSAVALNDIRADEPAKSEIARQTQRIQRYTAGMSRLVDDLLDVVSIEAGRLAVEPKREDAAELVRETLETFRPLAGAKKISLHTDVKAESLLGRFDHERLLQVLSNLVGNAIKFTQEGGRIDIVVETTEQEIRFAVADNGAGIAADKLEVVFDRFWQNTQRDRSSLGLGLYIARCIVEAHGGRIWADSRLGQGSTFSFTLPTASARSLGTIAAPADRR